MFGLTSPRLLEENPATKPPWYNTHTHTHTIYCLLMISQVLLISGMLMSWFYLSRKLSRVLLLLHQVRGIAHVVTTHHAVGVVHANSMNSEPAFRTRQEWIFIYYSLKESKQLFLSYLSIPIPSPSRSVNFNTNTCLSVFHLYLKAWVMMCLHQRSLRPRSKVLYLFLSSSGLFMYEWGLLLILLPSRSPLPL